jgi:putative hydrolase of the HAD superfamily
MTGRTWVFDLDNTLHDATPHIFPHINRSMTRYLETHLGLDHEEADRLRRTYWEKYGATLSGMMRHHGTKPGHFLQETHDFQELENMVVRNPGLRNALRSLRGKKIVFSNAPLHYALAVLKILGIRDLFDAVYAIEHSKYRPKPDAYGFFRIFRKTGLNPARFVMVEDTLENLRAAKQLGMKTVWVNASSRKPSYVDMCVPSIRHLSRRRIYN